MHLTPMTQKKRVAKAIAQRPTFIPAWLLLKKGGTGDILGG